MKPFRVALWIAKFVVSLILLLVIIPVCVFLGGKYVADSYSKRQTARQLIKTQSAARVEACVKDRRELVRAEAGLTAPIERQWLSEEPINKPDVGTNGRQHVWYFKDGSTMPLDEFIAVTQKDIRTACDIR